MPFSNRSLFFTGILLVVSGIFVASNIYTLIPIYGDLTASLQATNKEVVFGSTIFTFFYSFGLLTFGPLSDVIGRRKIIVFGLLCSAAATLLVGYSQNIGWLYISRAIQGLLLASFAPVTFTYCFELFPPKSRTLVISLINTGFLVAGILGQLTSQFFSDMSHWRDTFIFFSICYFSLFVIAFLTLPRISENLQSNENVFYTFKRILQNKQLVTCYIIVITLLFSFVCFYDALSRFYSNNPSDLFLIRVTGLLGAILSLFTGRLIAKWGEIRTLFLGILLGFSSMLGLFFYTSLQAIILLSTLFVSAISILIPTMITLIGSIAGVDRAKALSLYSFILLMGATIASPIASILSYKESILLLVFAYTMNVLLGVLIFKQNVRAFGKERAKQL
ncbi:MFS transporter [Bacillus carboniphilus]|uniref:MFS transporter n=1 Tax=Bacillus carboniphilus TaxID=86663 RepID=A0ABN0VPZ7_9BACI